MQYFPGIFLTIYIFINKYNSVHQTYITNIKYCYISNFG